MRYSASEKLEIIRLLERSHLSVRRTLVQIGVPPATFYRWYGLYQTDGPEAVEDRSPRPGRVWNRFPSIVAAAQSSLQSRIDGRKPRGASVTSYATAAT